jgi:hypothetical protein
MDIRILDYGTVEKAYMNIVLNHSEMIALATGLALIFAIFNIIREARKSLDKQIDVAMVLSLVKEYAGILAMILFLPWIITGFEEIFSIVEKSYMNQLGSAPNKDFIKVWKTETHDFAERAEDLGLAYLAFASVLNLEYLAVMIIQPFVILIDNWSYGFALVYRFIFLGVLKMVGGLAIACYIYEGTRSIFYTYIKNLAICYLLIPGFLFVTIFINGLRDVFLGTGQIQIGIVVMCVFLKIFGYATVTRLLHQSI